MFWIRALTETSAVEKPFEPTRPAIAGALP